MTSVFHDLTTLLNAVSCGTSSQSLKPLPHPLAQIPRRAIRAAMAENIQFHDFDQPDNFRLFHTLVRSFDSKNFVLEFNCAEARCAFDVGTEGFAALLAQRSKVCNVRSNCRTHVDLTDPPRPSTHKQLLQLSIRGGCEYSDPTIN